MQFKADYKYKARTEELSQKYKKLTPVFNFNSAVDVGFELGNKEVLISQNNGFDQERQVYRYKQIKKVISFTDGLLVIFKDKKFIFLPVTDNETQDEDLVYITRAFYGQIRGRFHNNGRLHVINYDSPKQKRKRVNLTFTDSPAVIMIIAVAVMLLGVLFATTPDSYVPVSRDKCIVYTGEYASFEKDEDDVIYIYFKNGDEQWIDYSCYSSELFSKIAALESGDKLEILLHPENEYVVELVCGKEELLNLDFAQQAMYEDVAGMNWLGYAIAALGVCAFALAIVRIVSERRYKSGNGMEAA